tara:strand:- start:312 stop:611 length:300 start_codon:yes stop_codon:yes gene_type:complete
MYSYYLILNGGGKMNRIISVEILYHLEGKAEPLRLLLHKNYKGDKRWGIVSNPDNVVMGSLCMQHIIENAEEVEDSLNVKIMKKERWKKRKGEVKNVKI